MSLNTIKNIIFDLDGTIIDPKVGITKSIQYAMDKLGAESRTTEELLWCIGPPLYDSFPILLNTTDKELVLKAVDSYREYYNKNGVYEHVLYDNIKHVLKSLKLQNFKLYIATSKPWQMAEVIAEYNHITDLFDGIYGCELDGTRSNKAELIAYVLEKEQLSCDMSIMIGDRMHDIIGAKKNRLTACGVTYGYGSFDELINTGADFIINDPLELSSII